MIRFILVNIFLIYAYLWSVENNRYITLLMWAIIPMIEVLMFKILEKKYVD